MYILNVTIIIALNEIKIICYKIKIPKCAYEMLRKHFKNKYTIYNYIQVIAQVSHILTTVPTCLKKTSFQIYKDHKYYNNIF